MYPGVFYAAVECNSMDNFFVQSYTNVYVRGNSIFTLWKSSKSFHISSDQCFISALSNVDRHLDVTLRLMRRWGPFKGCVDHAVYYGDG